MSAGQRTFGDPVFRIGSIVFRGGRRPRPRARTTRRWPGAMWLRTAAHPRSGSMSQRARRLR